MSKKPAKVRQATRIGAVASAFAGLMFVVSADCAAEDSQSLTRSRVDQIERYCATSWRNSRIPLGEWPDCTQQVFLELLERMSQEEIAEAIDHPESEQRRELNRAIWRIAKRIQRMERPLEMGERELEDKSSPSGIDDQHGDQDQLKKISQFVSQQLGRQQSRIFDMLLEGEPIHRIAQRLNTTPARISDAKYRAIQKIRRSMESGQR